jgi:hypothetical protein
MAKEYVQIFIDLCWIIDVHKILKAWTKELEMCMAFVQCNIRFFGK